MRALRTWVDRLIGLSTALGTIGIFAEVGIILVDVVGRAAGAPLFGSQDMITMIMVIVVFGGMALCDRLGGHIGVDLIEHKLSPGINRAIDTFSALLGAVIFVMMAYAIWESAKLSQMLNLSTNLLRWPKAWFQWALCGFALLTAAGMLLRAIEMAFFRLDVRRDQRR